MAVRKDQAVGRRDPICPWSLSKALIDYFTDQGSSVVKEIHDGSHEVRPEELKALAAFLTAPQPKATS